jgi:hypothetical protein
MHLCEEKQRNEHCGKVVCCFMWRKEDRNILNHKVSPGSLGSCYDYTTVWDIPLFVFFRPTDLGETKRPYSSGSEVLKRV